MSLIQNNLITVNNAVKDLNARDNTSTDTNSSTFKERTARGRFLPCRPQGWQKNAEHRKKIDKALENEDLKKKIDTAILKTSTVNKNIVDDKLLSEIILKSVNVSLISCVLENNNQHSRSYLRDSWIFDTSVKHHVCNNQSRFLTFKKTDDQIYTRDFMIMMEEYDSVYTYIINETGKEFKIILKNAAYILNVHTNIIAWKPCYHIEEVFEELLIAKYENKSDEMSALVNNNVMRASRESKTSSADHTTWHKRLEHPFMAAVKKLAVDATGVSITDENGYESSREIRVREVSDCGWHM
ncbi:hypothetical protein AJ78_06004 [Emergomyces pasteurianus Ep9510]|uniref:GAG-pre-integrase domain-containing protein n=1 Tax=Emergomyces pasteurianus Ep9510 TaxID=1447872 RepID=A0A1J9PAK0_9EURO|nr:hypothetical protein AJ78_06004 [Emergomyces pasteurianus Ep9510]